MSDKKKILYIVEAMGGGLFSYIVDLSNELVNNFDVYVAYAIRPQTPENFREYFDERVHLIEVKNFCRKIRLTRELKAINEVKKIADDIKPDIIHLHSSKAGAIGRLAFDGKQIPLFYTPHGYSFLSEKKKSLKGCVLRWVEAMLAKKKCTTISCGQGEHNETLKLTDNAVCINNAINVEKLKNSLMSVEKKEHPFTVFTHGRICHQKNPKLFNEIALAMPETRFLWIGDGELRGQLNASNIEITGWLQRAEALKRAANADVFLLVSHWEGFSISLLEAMYMKKVCVISNVTGNQEVIQNGENGYVCETVEDYVSAIRERNVACAEQAYADVMNLYDVKSQAESYAKVYMAKM